jgi:hypothetical protein
LANIPSADDAQVADWLDLLRRLGCTTAVAG